MEKFELLLQDTWLEQNSFNDENVSKLYDFYINEPSCNNIRNNYKALIVAFNYNNLSFFKYILELNNKDKFNIVWFSGTSNKDFDENKVDIYQVILNSINTKKFSDSKFSFTKKTRDYFKSAFFTYLISSNYEEKFYQYKVDKIYEFLNNEKQILYKPILTDIILYSHISIFPDIFNYFNEKSQREIINFSEIFDMKLNDSSSFIRKPILDFINFKRKEFEVKDLELELNLNRKQTTKRKI